MGYYPSYYGPAIYDLNFDWGRQSATIIVDAIKGIIPIGARILDVGTGTGNLAIAMASAAPESNIIGIDIEVNALYLARHKAELQRIRNVTFHKGDAYSIDFPDEAFDVLAANQLFGDQERILDQMTRVLRPGGLITLVRPHSPRSQMLEWRNETLREFAKRNQSKVPIEKMMMHSYSVPAVFQEMLAKRHMESIQVKEIDAPQGDGWPQHILTLLNSDHPFAGIRKNIAAIQEIDADNEEAITVAFYDFLQISFDLLKARFGGMVNTSFLLAMARKRN